MIITKLQGGLGNQMFQYAFAKSLAYKNKTTFKLDLSFLLDRSPRENFMFREFDLDIFNLESKIANDDDLVKKNQNNKFKSIISKFTNSEFIDLKENHFYFEESNFIKNKNVYLDGYWQSEKYFKDIENELREDFTFRNKLSLIEEEMNSKIQATNSICINFRRTDFVNLKNSAETHGTIGLEYYKKAVTLIASKISNPIFYVFSDDMEWCLHNFKINYPIIFVTHDFKGFKFSSYLQLMSNCKHFIIPNSTFAWWGAWLSKYEKKIVIAPDNWFNDTSLQNQTKDLIPESWIKL
jgi:hypothetical protein